MRKLRDVADEMYGEIERWAGGLADRGPWKPGDVEERMFEVDDGSGDKACFPVKVTVRAVECDFPKVAFEVEVKNVGISTGKSFKSKAYDVKSVVDNVIRQSTECVLKSVECSDILARHGAGFGKEGTFLFDDASTVVSVRLMEDGKWQYGRLRLPSFSRMSGGPSEFGTFDDMYMTLAEAATRAAAPTCVSDVPLALCDRWVDLTYRGAATHLRIASEIEGAGWDAWPLRSKDPDWHPHDREVAWLAYGDGMPWVACSCEVEDDDFESGLAFDIDAYAMSEDGSLYPLGIGGRFDAAVTGSARAAFWDCPDVSGVGGVTYHELSGDAACAALDGMGFELAAIAREYANLNDGCEWALQAACLGMVVEDDSPDD